MSKTTQTHGKEERLERKSRNQVRKPYQHPTFVGTKYAPVMTGIRSTSDDDEKRCTYDKCQLMHMGILLC